MHQQADFTTSGFYANFAVKVPVVLGSIPFHQNFAQYAPAPQHVQHPPLGWNFSPAAQYRDGSPNYPDLREYYFQYVII